MEMGLREWMIIIGGILILAVIVDGIRRMRLERKNAIRLSRRMRKPMPDEPEIDNDPRNPELPGGGVSRVKTRSDDFDPLLDDPLEERQEPGVPVLMESIPAEEELVPLNAHEESVEPAGPAQEELFASTAEPRSETTDDKVDSVASDVIIINIKDNSGQGIPGGRLLELLLACEVRFGEMDIFHRLPPKGKGGSTLFSVANLVEPGTFDVDKMDDFTTPGICLFMRLPGPAEPSEAFRLMLDTAQVLAENLDAELFDDQHCHLRQQTLEHLRQRVEEFERRTLLQT